MKKDAIIVVTVVLLILTILAKFTPYFSFDLAITETLQKFNPPWFDFLMNLLTFLGNPVSEITLTFGLAIYFYFRKLKLDSLLLLLSVGGIWILGEVVKVLINRPRPNPALVHQVGTLFGKDSFPSGHVLFYVGFFGLLTFLLEKRFKKTLARDLITALFLVLMVLIGISRIYLGAHWFSDVLGAYLLGFIWLNFVVFIYHKTAA